MWNTRFYKIICWYIVDLQCFKCTARWFWYIYIYICTSIHIYTYISDVYINTRKWMLSHIWLFVTPWAVACQAPLSMGFSRQEYWNGLPFLPPRDFLNTGIETQPLISPEWAWGFFTTTWFSCHYTIRKKKLICTLDTDTCKQSSLEAPRLYPLTSCGMEESDVFSNYSEQLNISTSWEKEFIEIFVV